MENEEIYLIENPITKTRLGEMAEKGFGDMIKGVVDIEKQIMALGGDLHADEESFLLERGSMQNNLWGINLYPGLEGEDFLEYDSMINIRPTLNNRSRSVEEPALRKKIADIVRQLIS